MVGMDFFDAMAVCRLDGLLIRPFRDPEDPEIRYHGLSLREGEDSGKDARRKKAAGLGAGG
jgi:hypothetical protein